MWSQSLKSCLPLAWTLFLSFKPGMSTINFLNSGKKGSTDLQNNSIGAVIHCIRIRVSLCFDTCI